MSTLPPTTQAPPWLDLERPAVPFLGSLVVLVLLFVMPFAHWVGARNYALLFTWGGALYIWWQRRLPLPPLSLPFCAALALGATSLLWSVDREWSMGEVRNELLFTWAAYAAFYAMTRSNGDLRRWLRALTAAAIVAALTAFAMLVRYHDWIDLLPLSVGDRNAYSTWAVFLLPTLLFALLHRPLAVAPRWLLLGAAALVVVSALLTLSRLTSIALAVAAILLLWLSRRDREAVTARRGAVVTLAAVFLAGLLALQFLAASEVKRIALNYEYNDVMDYVSGDPRPKIWAHAMGKIEARPWQGYGYGRGVLKDEFRDTLGDNLYWHAHNAFVDVALGTGLPGLAVYTWLIVALARALWRRYRASDPEVAALGAFGLTLLAMMLLRGTVDDVVVRENSLLFWSLQGMVLGLADARARRAAGLRG